MNIASLFAGLNRAAPGETGTVAWAVTVAGTSPGAAVLDAGCGTGADLAEFKRAIPGAGIEAVELAEEFIAEVRRKHPEVTTLVADMTDPLGGQFDLIRSAGSIYRVGVSGGLAAWRGLLAAGGRVAWAACDEPLAARIVALQPDAFDVAMNTGLKAGIDLWRVHGAEYGYRLIVAAPA